METQRPNLVVVVDTNILMEVPSIHEFDWGVQPVTVYVLDTVVDELRGLARDRRDHARGAAARHALAILEGLQQRSPPEGIPLPKSTGRLRFVGAPDDISPPLDKANVDHQQIALAQAHLEEAPTCFCAVVTRDREMAYIATSASPAVPVIRPGGGPIGRAIRRELATKMQWWKSFRHRRVAERPRSVKPARSPSRSRANPEAHKGQVIRSMYGRLRAARHRAVLSVAPTEVRLALIAHLLPFLTRHGNRVVFLFVESQAAAGYWAGELRRRCDLRRDAVRVFEKGGLSQVRGTQAVLYRHPQIEHRFKKHAARFAQAGRRVTAIVDGCDALDPVWMAMLLLGCDQFIGFTRHALGHAQTVGSRMLATFFEQETIATYTFADAESDGWLQPFDVLLHPATFDDEERILYEDVRARFIAAHSKFSRLYPELEQAADFGEPLYRILARVADHEAASLFPLREQCEELAQRARAKCDTVVELLSECGSPARCLVCDVDQVWTAVLRNAASDLGMAVEVLERSSGADAQEEQWRRFEAGKVDCLILQDVPLPRLVPARINRLMMMTPLTPLSTLASVVDWALSHATSGPAVCVDLLYTSRSPEQEAMEELADTCFGLHFGRTGGRA